jgi:hypothetical protein
MKDDSKKKLTSQLAIYSISNFFITQLPILVGCKAKGTDGAVCALLRHWQLGVYSNCHLLYENFPHISLQLKKNELNCNAFFIFNSRSDKTFQPFLHTLRALFTAVEEGHV